MTAATNPSPIRGFAVLAAVLVAVVAVVGVVVFYRKRDGVGPSESAPVSHSGATPPSRLDRDGRFLWLLDAQGLQLSRGNDAAIDDARRICSRLERGESEEQIVQDIVEGSPDMSADTATAFADIAIDVYCP